MLESCMQFGRQQIGPTDVAGKRVLEVGSRNVNGSLRDYVEGLGPREYIGIDIEAGPGVDRTMRADQVADEFGDNSFDLVISTELLEHVGNWWDVVSSLKRVCVEGGVILITTRSPGFPYHGFPVDMWRFTVLDMQKIFADCTIERLESDSEAPGVFVKARKPAGFQEKRIDDIGVYRVQEGRG